MSARVFPASGGNYRLLDVYGNSIGLLLPIFTTPYHDLHAVVFQAVVAQASGFIVSIVTYVWTLRVTELPFAPRRLPWALVGSLVVSLVLFLLAYACRLTTGGDGPAAFLVAFLVTSMMGTYGCYSAARTLALASRDLRG